MTKVFADFQATFSQRANDQLERILGALTGPHLLNEAMHYSVMNGGKRLRPVLVYASCEAANSRLDTAPSSSTPTVEPVYAARADAAAASIELLHSYSLVHDDLPAMDDDDLRRGKPSCHKAYGEAMAILVGDALQTLAFENLATQEGAAAELKVQLLQVLAAASGASGMVGGQWLDLDAERKPSDAIDLAALQSIHKAKTGALFCAAMEMGAICGEADANTRQSLVEYGHQIGLAFQIVDDILDVTATTEQLGKPQGTDQAAGKATYPALLGLDGARRYAQQSIEAALDTLTDLKRPSPVLKGLAEYVLSRSF